MIPQGAHTCAPQVQAAWAGWDHSAWCKDLVLLHSMIQAPPELFLPGCSPAYFTWISSCECSTPSRNVFSASCRAKAAGEKSGLRVLGGMGWVFRVRCSVLWWDYCISFFISIWIETKDKLDFKLRGKWGCNSTFLYQQVSNPNTPRHWFSFKITWWVGIN